jgi:hypothetical protein
MTLEVSVIGIGVLGPGLPNWQHALNCWTGAAQWQPSATVVPAPERLPATERRRAGAVVKAAIVVADQALAASGTDAGLLATVFTSSTGDPANCHLLCEALAAPQRVVSPTRFTNSVHNAPAGYWHIATASRAASTSLAAFDASFAAGLLEAAVQCHASAAPVLLVACDVPYPEPLHGVRPLSDVFAVALVLAPVPAPAPSAAPTIASAAGQRLRIDVLVQAEPTRCDSQALEALRQGIPAARALPLLQALAQAGQRDVVIEGLPDMALWVRLQAPLGTS